MLEHGSCSLWNQNANLEAEIAEFEQEYKSATSDKRKDELFDVILAARTNPHDLYVKKQQRQQELGK